MSSLADLHHGLARLVGWAFGSIADMDARGHLVLYTNAKGLPAIPAATVVRMKEIADREPDLSILQDALQVIDGLYEVYGASLELTHGHLDAAERAVRIFDGVFAFLFPLTIMAMRRGGSETAAKWLQVVAIIDDRIADNLRGFTFGRWAEMLTRGGATAYEKQPDALLSPQIAVVVLFFLLRGSVFEHNALTLNGGWESPYLDRAYGRPQTWRDTPTWIAQRTVSLHGTPPQTFTLARYAQAAPQAEPNKSVGITLVPVPRKRVFEDPSVPAPPIADPQGPGVWLRVDVQGTDHWTLGNGWTLDLRGRGAIGGLIPLGGDAEASAGAGAGLEAELTWRPAPAPREKDASPSTEGGEHGGASLAVESVSLVGFVGGATTLQTLGTLGLGVRAKKLKLSIAPKSAVLGALVNRSLAVNADVGIVLSDRGVTLEGGDGLELFLATKLELPFGFTLTYLRFAAIHRTSQTRAQLGTVEHDVETTEVGARLTVGLEWSYSRFQLILDGIGAEIVAQTNAPRGNVLGIGHIAGDLVLPSGVGLRMDWACVHGGGFFGYDQAHERFFGGVEVGFGTITQDAPKPKFVLRGVGFTEPREPLPGRAERDTTTFGMLTGEWGSWGLGALLATHRGVDLDAMRAGLATGAMDALLFPQDPVAQAAQIVASLAAFFPAAAPLADKHVIGLLGKYTWPSGFASITMGLIAEFSGSWTSWPTKIAVPFAIKVGKEGKLKSLLWIEIQGLGDYDAALDVLELHATLRNSRFIGADLVGGLVLFHGDPDEHDLDTTRGCFASIGGYHPSYFGGKGPQRASVDKRAGIVIQRGNAVRLEVSGYLAKSPAGIHFGVYGHLRVEALGFALDGKFWLDALVHSLDSWTIGVGGSVALILFDQTLTELSLEGEWTRTDKVRFAGSVRFKVLWWSVSKHTEKLLSDEIDTVEQAENAEAQIVAALTEPTSYPNTTPGGVTLVRRERPGVWSAPEQPLTFVQKYVPLDIQIERINASPLPGPTTFSIGSVALDGRDRAKAPALSEFAPAAFLALDTDAALHAPLAELWPAGFSAGDEIAVGNSEGATATLDEITVDRKQRARSRRRFPVSAFVRAELALPGVQPTAVPVRVQRPTYASRLGDAPATFGEAWAARGTRMHRTEGIE